MDSGVPFNTEPNVLRGMVPAPSLIPWGKDKKLELPEEIITSIPWRHAVKYTNNEIFFDIIEEIDAVMDLYVLLHCVSWYINPYFISFTWILLGMEW